MKNWRKIWKKSTKKRGKKLKNPKKGKIIAKVSTTKNSAKKLQIIQNITKQQK